MELLVYIGILVSGGALSAPFIYALRVMQWT